MFKKNFIRKNLSAPFWGLNLILSLAFCSTPVLAQDFVVHVNGIVCEFCSFGVAKKVSKLSFIDKSKYEKGVSVEVASQMVTVAVKPDVQLDKVALYEAIRSGGYDPVAIYKLSSDGQRTPYLP